MKSSLFALIAFAAPEEEVVKSPEYWPGLIGNPAIDWSAYETHLKTFQEFLAGQKLSDQYLAAFSEHFADFLHSVGKNPVPDAECLIGAADLEFTLTNGAWPGTISIAQYESCEEACDDQFNSSCVPESQLVLDQEFSSCECIAQYVTGQEYVPRLSDPTLPQGCLVEEYNSNDFFGFAFNDIKKAPVGCDSKFVYNTNDRVANFQKVCTCVNPT